MLPPGYSSQPPRRDLGLTESVRATLVAENRAAGFDVSQSAGLFVGVRAFTEDAGLTEIPFAADDAVDLAHAFSVQNGLISAANLFICLSGEPQKEESRQRLALLQSQGARVSTASRVRVLNAIDQAVRATGPNGMIVCSLATHGFQHEGLDYFLASDSLRAKVRQTALLLSELDEDLRKSPTRRRMLLIDTCREKLDSSATRAIGGGMSGTLAEALAKVEGAVVLSATVAGGYAYDDPALGNGVFSRAILDGMAGEARVGGDGLLRARDLADFVHARVVAWVKQNQPHSVSTAGIQRNISGSGAELPLGLDPEIYTRAREVKDAEDSRLQGTRAILGQAFDLPGFTGQLIDQILSAIKTLSGHEREALLKRIEKLGKEREDYADDFLAWWELHHARTASPTPLPVASAPPVVAPQPSPFAPATPKMALPVETIATQPIRGGAIKVKPLPPRKAGPPKSELRQRIEARLAPYRRYQSKASLGAAVLGLAILIWMIMQPTPARRQGTGRWDFSAQSADTPTIEATAASGPAVEPPQPPQPRAAILASDLIGTSGRWAAADPLAHWHAEPLDDKPLSLSAFFIGSSRENGLGEVSGREDIDTDGVAFGINAMYVTAMKVSRIFLPLQPGEQLSLQWDHGVVVDSGEVGINFLNDQEQELLQFTLIGGSTNYSLTDADGTRELDLRAYDGGVELVYTPNENGGYALTIHRLSDGEELKLTGNVISASEGTGVAAFNLTVKNPGIGKASNVYLNRIYIRAVP